MLVYCELRLRSQGRQGKKACRLGEGVTVRYHIKSVESDVQRHSCRQAIVDSGAYGDLVRLGEHLPELVCGFQLRHGGVRGANSKLGISWNQP